VSGNKENSLLEKMVAPTAATKKEAKKYGITLSFKGKDGKQKKRSDSLLKKMIATQKKKSAPKKVAKKSTRKPRKVASKSARKPRKAVKKPRRKAKKSDYYYPAGTVSRVIDRYLRKDMNASADARMAIQASMERHGSECAAKARGITKVKDAKAKTIQAKAMDVACKVCAHPKPIAMSELDKDKLAHLQPTNTKRLIRSESNMPRVSEQAARVLVIYLMGFVREVVSKAEIISKGAGRKTISLGDVKHALQVMGMKVYM